MVPIDAIDKENALPFTPRAAAKARAVAQATDANARQVEAAVLRHTPSGSASAATDAVPDGVDDLGGSMASSSGGGAVAAHLFGELDECKVETVFQHNGHDCGLYVISVAQALCAEALEPAEGAPRTPTQSPAAVLALTPAAVDKKRAQMLGLIEAYAPS